MSAGHPRLGPPPLALHRSLALLLLAALWTAFFFNLHAFPLFDLDEGAFSEATRDMLARGDWIATYLYGEPRYDKPILIYWLQALSVSLFGLQEWALRLPSALASTAWMLLIYAFCARLGDARTGLIAATLGASAFAITVVGKAAIADGLLNLLIAAAMFAIYLHYTRRQPRYIYLAFIAMGLGFLTKGPVAVVIPLLASLLFYLLKGQGRAWLAAAFNPLGLGLFLALVLPWYLTITWREGPGFLLGFLLEHNLGRFQAPMHGHSGPLFFYLPVLLVALLPYSSLLVRTLWEMRRSWVYRQDLHAFLLVWFAVVLVLFSLSGTKLPHYILYGVTPLLILMALHLETLKSRAWLFLPAVLMFAFLLLVPDLLSWLKPQLRDAYVLGLLTDHHAHFSLLWRLYFALALGISLYFMFATLRRNTQGYRLLLLGLLLNIGTAGLVLPAISAIQQGPIYAAAQAARAFSDEAIVMWRLNTPSFNVYTQRVIERRTPQVGEIALTREDSLPRLGEYELLFAHNGVVLVRVLRL
ncbi:ArnT family glycosyltransferase [Thiorhodospira sibirica]|uniref:ArnT family glycosyltransferase n=1 Tax=Thiorhodospira sibirica TaxID=154347 RepID=UPI00022C4645|nr:glycosyltransferase family 39 protein [Thiorhodospira sibirica]